MSRYAGTSGTAGGLMCEQERLGFFYFWREVGRRMGIKDIPADFGVRRIQPGLRKTVLSLHRRERTHRDGDARTVRFLVSGTFRTGGSLDDSRHAGRSAHRSLRVSPAPSCHAQTRPGRPEVTRALASLLSAEARSSAANRDETPDLPRRSHDRATRSVYRPSSFRTPLRPTVG